VSDKMNLKKVYSDFVRSVTAKSTNEQQAMGQAVGGEFEAFGLVERDMLKFYGLKPDGYLIDVGCGAGRLALPLSQWSKLKYLGTDIVADMVRYARETVNRADWTFVEVDALLIPEENDRADMVCFFSVLTHLLHEQSYIYLEEARRVLKPGGTIVFSFLDFQMPMNWEVFAATVNDAKGPNRNPLNVFISRDAIQAWATHLKLDIIDIRYGDERFVPLSGAVTLSDGTVMSDFGTLGQSICVLRKPVE
jgi:SAM-dependent methyltransferase